MTSIPYLDFKALDQTPLQQDPYPFLIIPNFILPAAFSQVSQDFPAVPGPGSHPPAELTIKGHFAGLMDELNGEKIDIVDYSENPAVYVANALAPAKVTSCEVVDLESKSAKVIVPDYQLSLAIGKDGQNARLAARLTGWRIDIHPDNPVERIEKPKPVSVEASDEEPDETGEFPA